MRDATRAAAAVTALRALYPASRTGALTLDASEGMDPDSRFLFDVPIIVPLLGRLVRYHGPLAIEA